jgi:hypothetical protein
MEELKGVPLHLGEPHTFTWHRPCARCEEGKSRTIPFHNNSVAVQPLPNIGLNSCDAHLLSGIKISMTQTEDSVQKLLSTTTLNAVELLSIATQHHVNRGNLAHKFWVPSVFH